MSAAIKQPCDEAVILSAPPATPYAPDVARWVLAATILGSSLALIDGTVVNVALPILQADLKATVADAQWVIEAYSLFLSALILVSGALSAFLLVEGTRRSPTIREPRDSVST